MHSKNRKKKRKKKKREKKEIQKNIIIHTYTYSTHTACEALIPMDAWLSFCVWGIRGTAKKKKRGREANFDFSQTFWGVKIMNE